MEYFLWPFMLLILPLPWLVRIFSAYLKKSSLDNSANALRVPFFDRVVAFGSVLTPPNPRTIRSLLILSWLGFVVAAMRPVTYDTTIEMPREARNIMLAIDVSGSMGERDFDVNGQPISRLNLVKNVVSDFISKRTGDRLGLIVFGSEAHTLAPLSSDLKTLSVLFSDVGIGIAGEQTAIGDALALAVEDTAKVPADKKVIILLSDGYNNAGVIPVKQAIELAQKQKITVYTIGIASDQSATSDFWGMLPIQTGPNLDEKMLTAIAQETGGRYFRAKSTQDLISVYQMIEKMEMTPIEDEMTRPRVELFYIPLLFGLVCWVMAWLKRRQS